MRWPLAALLAALSGCEGGRIEIRLPPDDAQVAAKILAVEVPGREPPLEILAFERNGVPGGEPLPSILDLDRDTAVALTLFRYPTTLARLRVEPGRVPLPGPVDGLPLSSSGARIEGASVVGLELRGWEALEKPPASLDAIRLPGSCSAFKTRAIPIESSGTMATSVALDDRTALILTTFREAFRVDSRGQVEQLQLPPGVPVFWSVALDSERRLWFGGEDGTLWRSSPIASPLSGAIDAVSLTPALTTGVGFERGIAWLEGARPGESFELYGLTSGGWFGRIREDGSGETIHLFQELGTRPDLNRELYLKAWRGGLSRLGPGRAVAVKGDSPEIVSVNGAEITVETVPGVDAYSGTATAEVPGFGAVLGTGRGSVVIGGAREWRLVDLGSGHQILSVLPYGEGFLFAGALGLFGEFRTDGNRCPTRVISVGEGTRMIPFARDDGAQDVFVATGKPPTVPQLSVLIQEAVR